MNAGHRDQLVSVINLVDVVHPRIQAALSKLRQDDGLLTAGIDYVMHIERELTEAMIRLDGARFGAEALLAKLPDNGSRDVRPDDVPLRRLILKVVQPDEQVLVAEVVERLTGLGQCWQAPSVSNALGYLVSRGRLVRVQRGLYLRPSDLHTGPAANAEGNAG